MEPSKSRLNIKAVMGTLIQCIYSSVASGPFSEEGIPALLGATRIANRLRNVTGMLVYINGLFLQVLEGEASIVDPLFTKIKKDPRHARVTLHVREPITTRSFGQWTMGFEALLPADVGQLIGENDFFEDGLCVGEMNESVAKTLLSAFRDAQTHGSRTLSLSL